MTGTELKLWRKKMSDLQGKKLKQKDAAILFGVSYRTYQRWECQDKVASSVGLACIALWQGNSLGDKPWLNND